MRKTIVTGALVVFLLSLPALAQNVEPACGPDPVRFQIRANKKARPATPAAGEALVYLIEDNTGFNWVPEPSTRAAVDGQWRGAVHGNAAMAFELAPGAHRICARWQDWSRGGASMVRGIRVGYSPQSATVALDAEAGRTYYYLVRNLYDPHDSAAGAPHLELTPLPETEGQRRAARLPFDVAKVAPAMPFGGLIKKK